ncbi:MAG: zinc ribbon domain-containing protein [Acidobacteria bacterium]|nr:zinc ribbon domain-containing protein [Acidobacteriota bacterium]
MSLITCPECAHEVSTTANACPNCGHTFIKPVVQRNVVVSEVPRERDDFPKWIFIPLGILGVVLLFILLAYMRNSNDEEAAQRNIGVNVATQRQANGSLSSTARTDSAPNEIVVPPSSSGGQVVVPDTSAPVTTAPPSSSSQTVTTIPPSTVASDKGTVQLEAKIAGKTGNVQPVKAERFYLLDKDLQSILSDADIEDETGQGLTNAFGLSVVNPSKYGETNKKAMNAINKHIVYRTQTDASGKASMKDVKPATYYLFGVTKTSNGFAIWSSPVTIQPGENSLVLPPAHLTEIIE